METMDVKVSNISVNWLLKSKMHRYNDDNDNNNDNDNENDNENANNWWKWIGTNVMPLIYSFPGQHCFKIDNFLFRTLFIHLFIFFVFTVSIVARTSCMSVRHIRL